jgi:hypothetical protein
MISKQFKLTIKDNKSEVQLDCLIFTVAADDEKFSEARVLEFN